MDQPMVDMEEQVVTEVADKRRPMVEIAEDDEARRQLRTMAAWWDINQPLALARVIKIAFSVVKQEIGDVGEFEASISDDPADQ